MGFWSNLALRATHATPSENGEWGALFGQTGAGAGIPLGTARWMAPEAAAERLGYSGSLFTGRVWIGEGFDRETSRLGYEDDRHVCLVSGSRGGKGVGVIVPNLCFWPGSCIVVDPKGENATVTARRRGGGSEYTHALGQKVCILDPFGEVQLPAELKARYNPLDAIDPDSDLAIDDAGRVASALVVIESRNEPYWEEAARNLIKGLILHVLSAVSFEGQRNLVTVRRLLTQGDWLNVGRMREAEPNKQMPSAFEVLWSSMCQNSAFHGVVAGVGEQMTSMGEKQRSGVLESARTNTEFLDSIPMQRLLETSDFDLGEIKTNPQGLTVYLTLPQRFMETHFRWLRLMIVLAIGEMERIKGRPAAGHPTLFLLDEFAGLKRMEVIENAAAQAAGFGVKFLFVVQNLPQLQELYEKSWETFFGNSGLKLFFQIDDDFSRSYLSRQLGELETLRQTQSGSESRSNSWSTTEAESFTTNVGGSSGLSRGRSTGFSLNYGRFFRIFSTGESRQSGANRSTSHTRSWGRSRGTSFSRSRSQGNSTTSGWGEGVHKRPLLNPDEIGRLLARVDDRRRPGYPGLVLALVPGEHPLLARRVNYFDSPWFLGYFDPHPNHPPPPTLHELGQMAAAPKPPAPPPWRPGIRDFLARPVVLGGLLLAVTLTAGLWIFSGGNATSPKMDDLGFKSIPHIKRSAAISAAAPAQPLAEPKPATPAAYAQGVADWGAQKMWFDAQTGDRRAGADYWAANRTVRGHASCTKAAEVYGGDHRFFVAGCLDAKGVLDPIDARRVDPQYRAGFTDEAKRFDLGKIAQSKPTAAAIVETTGARYAVGPPPDHLVLRDGPSVEYSIVKLIPPGIRVRIIRDANRWKEIEFRDINGQVFHGFSYGEHMTPVQ